MLDIHLLGPLTALLDGRPVELPADARARELLGWLAFAPGPHARSALAGRLRPDVGEQSARKTLRDAVYELRRALGPAGSEAVIATREQVGLRDDAVRIDVREFRRLRAAGELDAAVAHCRGELLAGMDADWILRARDEHAAELADTLGALAAQAEAAGDLGAAVAWARRRIEVEPLAEAAHRDLIRLLALAGDRPAALTAADALTERLRRRLGVPPTAETRALVDEVRRGLVTAVSATEGGAQLSLPAPLARTTRPEGRDPVLGRVLATWQDALAGASPLALVEGEPGIGKTTFAGEFARRVHQQGAAVLYGRSDEHAPLPFQPWVEALERLLDELPTAAAHWLTVHEGALARLLPTRSADRPPADGPRERYLAFATVRTLLEHVAQQRPLLLVLDDLHWADEDSLALLRHVARTAPQVRTLILLCVRQAELPTPAADTLAQLRREAPMLNVRLGGLDDDAVAAVLGRHGADADADAARRYRERTGGNPFFLEELVRDEQERAEDADAPPRGVREVVARRLERLSPGAQGALAVAAVIGLEFTLEALAGAGAGDPVELLDALDEAAAAGLVRPAHPGTRHAFVHALVGETIASALPAGRRAQLHLRVAEHLAASHARGGPARAGQIARHLRAAMPLVPAERLAEWELAAAREALATLAYADAAAHYEAALALETGPRDQRGAHLLALGHAQDRAGRRDQARAAFSEAAALARATRDAHLLARAALGYGGLAVVIAAPEPRTHALLEEALAAIADGERSATARLRARLAVELHYAEPERARDLSEAALADARASEDPAALVPALNARRVALWSPAHIDERLVVVEEMLQTAERVGDRESALQARNWRVVDLWELGRIDEVTAEIDAYERLAEQAGLPHYSWYVPLWRAGLALLNGRWEAAGALGERALTLGEQADDPNAPLLVRVQRQFALDIQRRFTDIDRDWLARVAPDSAEPAPWLGWLAMIDAATGRHADARAAIADLARDDFAAVPMRTNWLAACELADAAADAGDRPAAAALHARLLPHADLYAVIARGVGSENITEHYLGRLAATLGDLDEAETRLRRATAANDRAGARPYAAATTMRLGEVLAARGDHVRARDTLTQTVARAEALQMNALATQAATALAQLDS